MRAGTIDFIGTKDYERIFNESFKKAYDEAYTEGGLITDAELTKVVEIMAATAKAVQTDAA